MQPDNSTPTHASSPPGVAAETREPLEYGVSRASTSSRSWAWAFLVSGGYAVLCIPAGFIFEHVGWSDGPLHFTSFFACIICAVSAAKYLWTTRAEGEGSDSMRSLAYVALTLAGGLLLFALLVVLLAVLLVSSIDDF